MSPIEKFLLFVFDRLFGTCIEGRADLPCRTTEELRARPLARTAAS
jgi:hypothetical protein